MPAVSRTACSVGSYVCLKESRGYSREQMVRTYTWAPDFYARLFLGYLVHDLTCMLLCASRKELRSLCCSLRSSLLGKAVAGPEFVMCAPQGTLRSWATQQQYSTTSFLHS